MKNFITAAIIFIICLPVSVFGAGEDSLIDTVERDIETFRNELYESNYEELISGGSEAESPAMKEFLDRFCSFDYEIYDEIVEEDTAIVKIKVTTYNYGDATQEALGKIFLVNKASEFSKSSDIDEEKVKKIFFETLAEAETKNYTKEVELHYKRENTEWITNLDDNEEFLDAVYGGFNSRIDELEIIRSYIINQVRDEISIETNNTSKIIGSYEVIVPDEWGNDGDVFFPENMYELPIFRIFHSDVFADFEEIRDNPEEFKDSVVSEHDNETIVEDLHLVKYNDQYAYAAILEYEMDGYHVRMWENFFEDPTGGLLGCYYYESIDAEKSYIRDYWDILMNLRITDENTVFETGPLGETIHLSKSGDHSYEITRTGEDKMLIWDAEADCYYDESSECWAWLNTDITPAVWQYWYDGISSDFGDYGWMEHDAEGWFIEKSYGVWIELPEYYTSEDLWFIREVY